MFIKTKVQKCQLRQITSFRDFSGEKLREILDLGETCIRKAELGVFDKPWKDPYKAQKEFITEISIWLAEVKKEIARREFS